MKSLEKEKEVSIAFYDKKNENRFVVRTDGKDKQFKYKQKGYGETLKAVAKYI